MTEGAYENDRLSDGHRELGQCNTAPPPTTGATSRLWQFAAASSHMEETTRPATTIDIWWPALLVALIEDVTNARTEGLDRVIKQTKRVGCELRNTDKYERRIMSHMALT